MRSLPLLAGMALPAWGEAVSPASTAAIAAYPQLGVTDAPLAVSSEWDMHANLFNADEPMPRFIDHLSTDIAALFPGTYIHVGGDETVKDQWLTAPHTQTRGKALGGRDVAQMQIWMIERIEKTLTAHGKRLSRREEILEGRLPAEATVMSWRSIEGGIEAARQGRAVVMLPSSGSIVDAISAEDIGKFPDTNAAESLAHLPGITIDRQFGEDEKVSVNGADPALDRVLLNGQTITSGETTTANRAICLPRLQQRPEQGFRSLPTRHRTDTGVSR